MKPQMKSTMSSHTVTTAYRGKTLVRSSVLGLSLALISQAPAALILDVGNFSLLPNQANQLRVFQVENTGGAPVETLGIQFNIQIADGSASVVAPTITLVDILTSTIFQNDNNGQGGAMDTVHRWEVNTLENITPPKPSVPTGFSTVATVTFDTTGFSAGTWSLSLTTPAASTAYFDPVSGNRLAMTIFDGTLSVVPEPVNVALPIFGSLVVLFGGARRWCRRKASAD